MFIRLLIVFCFIFISYLLASCPYIRTSVILAECVLDTSLYLSLGAHIFNSHSIDFIGHYSFNNNNTTDNFISNTLIYNLSNRWVLLIPLLLKCAHQPINLTFTECQYTMRPNKYPSKSPSITEYMTTYLSVNNITDLGMQSVLYLQPGDITLRSCKAFDCSKQLVYLTASNETFNFKIDYEKPIGTKCQSDEDCSNRYSLTNLIQCDQISQTCQCFNENITTIDISNVGRLCTDSIDRSNCTKFPQRCLQWCNESKTSHCICPKYTRKVRKVNGIFDCELEPTGICRFNDEQDIGLNIRKCPTGTYCNGNRCRPLSISRQIYDYLPNESSLTSTTSMFDIFSSTTTKQIYPPPMNFFRTLIIVAIASLLFFIFIVFIIAILIKSHRFRVSSFSEDKISSSSFAPSISTAISTDLSNDIYQFKQQQPTVSLDYSRRYDNYLTTRSTYIHGIVPQSNLSPRFYRQYQGFDERRRRRRAPLQIESPSLSSIDHELLTTKKYIHNNNTKTRTHLPIVTHLHNGDVLISA
ncbi:unnamed protein product [Adineta steineri]|uniref:Uncharacterized protein n=1 Tax=Adineta steineri TaxID=433720 RepID=A0A819LMP7_9BILA|nr:unnamed protein product [Adineta steineri]